MSSGRRGQKDLSWVAAYGIVLMLGLTALGAVSSIVQRWDEGDRRIREELKVDQLRSGGAK